MEGLQRTSVVDFLQTQRSLRRNHSTNSRDNSHHNSSKKNFENLRHDGVMSDNDSDVESDEESDEFWLKPTSGSDENRKKIENAEDDECRILFHLMTLFDDCVDNVCLITALLCSDRYKQSQSSVLQVQLFLQWRAPQIVRGPWVLLVHRNLRIILRMISSTTVSFLQFWTLSPLSSLTTVTTRTAWREKLESGRERIIMQI